MVWKFFKNTWQEILLGIETSIKKISICVFFSFKNKILDNNNNNIHG